MIHWRLDTLRYIRKRLPPNGIIEEVVSTVSTGTWATCDYSLA